MIRQTLTLCVIFLLAGCDNVPKERERIIYEAVCTEETAEARAEFIINCIKYGNPKSDEEPEDWIPICQSMAEETLCKMQKKWIKEQLIGCCWRRVGERMIEEVKE